MRRLSASFWAVLLNLPGAKSRICLSNDLLASLLFRRRYPANLGNVKVLLSEGFGVDGDDDDDDDDDDDGGDDDNEDDDDVSAAEIFVALAEECLW